MLWTPNPNLKRVSLILFIVVVICCQKAFSQITIRGTVYDSTGISPVQYVSVLATSGSGTITNQNGDYMISVSENDSIWFSYLNKPTRKFPVKMIKTPFAFNISLQTFVSILSGVKTRNKNYKLDSIQNRTDYAKIFDYERPGLKPSVNSDGSVGFDLNEVVNSFRFRRNKQILSFQNRLVSQEKETFVRHRFSKSNVRRITQATDDSVITRFINLYLPSYFFTSTANDYTFFKYIKDSYERFRLGLHPSVLWLEGATEIGDRYDIYRREN